MLMGYGSRLRRHWQPMRHFAAPRAGVVANEVPGVRLIPLIGVVGKVFGSPPPVALLECENVNAGLRRVSGGGWLWVFHSADSNVPGRRLYGET